MCKILKENQILFIIHSVLIAICLGKTINVEIANADKNYNENRINLLEDEDHRMLGGRIKLNEKEEKVNDLLLKVKGLEVEAGINDIANYAPALHFFKAKDIIKRSRVFKFINRMPKGSLLHGHNAAMVSSEWLLKNATYRQGCGLCKTKRNVTIITFRKKHLDCDTDFRLLSELRTEASSIEEFDIELEKSFNLYTPTPEIDHPDINSVWKKFQAMFATVSDLIRYLPVFKDFHMQLLQELYDDNIMYAEIRTSFGELYDEDDRIYTDREAARIMRDTFREFTKTHSGFLGAKTIYAIGRLATNLDIRRKIVKFNALLQIFPEFIVGFDLVGQEDIGFPLKSFYPELQAIPKSAKFFFHAGETNWYGSSPDLNLLDAILLNTTRIGHGYAVAKHPSIMQAIKERGIGIEISPLSNQVLGLVHDLRNHPGAYYIAEDMPIVIASDDPGFWNAKGLSYDYYYALMSFAPENAGLKTLKQLVLNSINFSIFTEQEKLNAEIIHNDKWEKFLDDILAGEII